MTETAEEWNPHKGVVKELNRFRAWFSALTFLLTATAFTIGFPALEEAGRYIGLGVLSFGLPFAIDLGMVTLLLWSMWNRGVLKRAWPPLIPAALLLGLSSWLQYIHAVKLIDPDTPTVAWWGLIVLAVSLPLLLALSAGVFEAVTFAPLIERAKTYSETEKERLAVEKELWRDKTELEREKRALEASLQRTRLETESRVSLKVLEAEAEAEARALRGPKKTPVRAAAPVIPKIEKPSETINQEIPKPEPKDENTSENIAAAVDAVRSGSMSQRAASEYYGIGRAILRRHLEQVS